MTSNSKTAADEIVRIRAVVSREGRVTRKALLLVESALTLFPCAANLWCLRGQLILLLDEAEDMYSFDDAVASFEKAISIEPCNPEPFEELGHFYDAVKDDPARALPFFERAIALGAGQGASDGLADALEQLQGEKRQ